MTAASARVDPRLGWGREELTQLWRRWDKPLRQIYLYWREAALEEFGDEPTAEERLRAGAFAAERALEFQLRSGYVPGADVREALRNLSRYVAGDWKKYPLEFVRGEVRELDVEMGERYEVGRQLFARFGFARESAERAAYWWLLRSWGTRTKDERGGSREEEEKRSRLARRGA